MFDFFREMLNESRGIDTEMVKTLNAEKKEQEKLSRYILSRSVKAVMIALSIIYIIMTAATLLVIYHANMPNVTLRLVWYIFMMGLASAVCISVIIGGKKGEITALIISFVFVVALYLSVLVEIGG